LATTEVGRDAIPAQGGLANAVLSIVFAAVAFEENVAFSSRRSIVDDAYEENRASGPGPGTSSPAFGRLLTSSSILV
jgi:hypothetical protein